MTSRSRAGDDNPDKYDLRERASTSGHPSSSASRRPTSSSGKNSSSSCRKTSMENCSVSRTTCASKRLTELAQPKRRDEDDYRVAYETLSQVAPSALHYQCSDRLKTLAEPRKPPRDVWAYYAGHYVLNMRPQSRRYNPVHDRRLSRPLKRNCYEPPFNYERYFQEKVQRACKWVPSERVMALACPRHRPTVKFRLSWDNIFAIPVVAL